MKIILASKSPRRRELLGMLGVGFEISAPDVDESCETDDPAELVREVSQRKARAVRDGMTGNEYAPREDIGFQPGVGSQTIIIAADTVVHCAGEILGKPRDRSDAARMLRLLSGREHRVYSGLSIICGEREITDVSCASVRFGNIAPDELERYLERADYLDKAGAYAIQGYASVFIDKIDGDFFTVMGLPLRRLYILLRREFGTSLPGCGERL